MMRYARRGERGQTLPLAAVMMIALVGMLAMAVDSGLFIETRRQLQNAADAAALAGVAKMPDDPNGAIADAKTYVTNNDGIFTLLCRSFDVNNTANAAITPGARAMGSGYVYTVTVTLTCDVNYTFGRILNLTDKQIRATGVAAIGSLGYSKCPLPLAVEDLGGNPEDGFGYAADGSTLYAMKVGPDQSETGNFHAIDILGTGADKYRAQLSGQQCGSVSVGQTIPTETGNMVGPTTQALEDRGLVKPANPAPVSPLTLVPYDLVCPWSLDEVVDMSKDPPEIRPGQENNPCLGIVPVIPAWTWDNAQGKTPVTVEGFALFFMVGYAHAGQVDQIDGYFIKVVAQSEIGPYYPIGPLTLRLIR